MKKNELRQNSLLELLVEDNSLSKNLQTSNSITTYDPKLLGPLQLKNIKVISPQPYSGVAKEGYIIKRKYLVCRNYFIAEGLTHSDYTITWEGFDDHGSGKGKLVVDNDQRININFEGLDTNNVLTIENCLWIGGDTINKPNYAHWMFEHLLKLEIFRISGADFSLPIVVSNRLPNSFLHWGDLLSGRKLIWERVDLSNPIKFKNMCITSCPAFRRKNDMLPAIWIEGFQNLRQRLIKVSHCYPKTISAEDQVIFLSRQSGAHWRRAVNEGDLFLIAKQKYNARLISISDHSPVEQIQLIYKAKVLICFGGADGIACNFINPQGKVLEILAPGHVATYTAQIYCEINKIEYHRMSGTKFVTDQKGPHPLDRDYYVDPVEYSDNLNALL